MPFSLFLFPTLHIMPDKKKLLNANEIKTRITQKIAKRGVLFFTRSWFVAKRCFQK